MDAKLLEYRPSGELLRSIATDIAAIRTVAYAKSGWYVGGIASNTMHSVQYVDGAGHAPSSQPQMGVAGTVISILRPSPDTVKLRFVRRKMDPRLFEMELSQ
jgi:hypothetical protein